MLKKMNDYDDIREKLKENFEYAAGRKDVQGASMAAMAIAAIDTAAVKGDQKDAVDGPKTLLINIVDMSGSMQYGSVPSCVEEAFNANQKEFKSSFPEGAEQLFLQHTTKADWVSGEDFLTPCAPGGSLLSPAYEKVRDVVEKYKSTDTQLFIHHITDGDSYSGDVDTLKELLDGIMPHITGLRYSKIDGVWGDSSVKRELDKVLDGVVECGKVHVEPCVVRKPKQDFYPKPIV
tara:strand:+ start:149599 stop:150300 length:702 start_codon:yes stop_codon:yes gene_type:complete